MPGRPINESRVNAIIQGERTYEGAEHWCGSTVRYVRGGGCVLCARRIQTEQRDARKALTASKADAIAAPVRHPQPWD
jgi:hypothetical protein